MWLQRPFEDLKAKSVLDEWVGTIGPHQGPERDNAVFVTAGIHFCRERTMRSASVPYSTILYCTDPPLKTPDNIQSMRLTSRGSVIFEWGKYLLY